MKQQRGSGPGLRWGLRGWLQPGEMRTNKLSEAISSPRQWTRECTTISVHQHLPTSSLCLGASAPHHRLTVGSAVMKPTVPPDTKVRSGPVWAELAIVDRDKTSASGCMNHNICSIKQDIQLFSKLLRRAELKGIKLKILEI